MKFGKYDKPIGSCMEERFRNYDHQCKKWSKLAGETTKRKEYFPECHGLLLEEDEFSSFTTDRTGNW